MAKAYDYDFRRKVLEAIECNGMTPSEASQWFSISRNRINEWFHLTAETGGLKPRPKNYKGNGEKIKDWEKFKAFVEANPDKTQKELAELWETKISDRTIGRALKRINFTRKKRLTGIGSEMKRKEQNLVRI